MDKLKKAVNKSFRLIATITAVSLVLMLTCVAWFAIATASKSRTQAIDIEAPPTLIIGDYTGETLVSLDLTGMTIGTVYQYVFCIKKDENSSVNDYLLTLIYTGNLKETMTLYPATHETVASSTTITYKGNYYTKGNALTPTIITSHGGYDGGDSVDGAVAGVYQRYAGQIVNGGSLTDYYILEISWASNEIINSIDPKETDLVYILVKTGLNTAER